MKRDTYNRIVKLFCSFRCIISCHIIMIVIGLGCLGCTRNESVREHWETLETRKDSLENALKTRHLDHPDSLANTLAGFRRLGDSTAVAMAYYTSARALHHQQEYTSAIANYRHGIRASEHTGDTVLHINILHNVGTCYRRMGTMFEASDQLYTALNMAEQYSLRNTKRGKELRSYIYNNLGNIYKYLNNREEAEALFRRALALDKELGNILGMAKNYSTLGNLYEHRNMFDSAYVMYHKALEYDIQAGSRLGIGICHNRLGQLMMHYDSIDAALAHHQKAYELLNDSRYDTWNRLKASLSMAWIYLLKHDLPKVYTLLEETEQEALRLRSFGHLEEVYYCLAEYYRQQGNYKKAFEQQALCLQYRDSISKQRNEQEVAQNSIRYERRKSEFEINRLNLQHEKVKANRRVILISSIIVASILIMLLVLSYFFIRLQRRRNRELYEMNATKDKFFSIISHDLKNPAVAQRNALQGLVNNGHLLDEDSLAEYYEMLLKSADSQVELLYNLLDWARVQTGRLPYNPSVFELETTLKSEIELLQIAFTNKDITVTTDFGEACLVNGDRNMVATVFRNLLSNAIKFTNQGGKIEVRLTKKDHEIHVSVKDNGVGISSDKIPHLFKLDREQSTPGTWGETGSGLGLMVCKSFVERNGGTLTVKSIEGRGTTFSFTVRSAHEE